MIRSTECPLGIDDQRESYSCLLVVSIGYRQQAAAKRVGQIRSVTPLPLFAKVVSVALGGRSLPQSCAGVRVAVGQPERTGGSAGDAGPGC